MMLHVFNQFKSDFSYYINRTIIIRRNHLPIKISDYLLRREFLWFKIKDNNNGYRHFIFRESFACDEICYSKTELINRWFNICIGNKNIAQTYTKQELRDIKIRSILDGR